MENLNRISDDSGRKMHDLKLEKPVDVDHAEDLEEGNARDLKHPDIGKIQGEGSLWSKIVGKFR